MSGSPNQVPTERTARRGDVTLDDRLDAIEQTLKDILNGQTQEAAASARNSLRLRALEVVVYGGCAMALTAVVGALLFLVIKGGRP